LLDSQVFDKIEPHLRDVFLPHNYIV